MPTRGLPTVAASRPRDCHEHLKPDNTLYAASIQSMPFARPNFDDLLKAVDFIVSKSYPPRGTAA